MLQDAASSPRAISPHRRFREIYRANYPFVWASLYRFGVAQDQIEDAIQETFLVAFRRSPSRKGIPVRPWLYGIARRIASNHRRAVSRRTRKASAMLDARPELTRNVEAAYAALRELDRYLGALGMRDRELFVLSEVEGLTGPELAEALGTNLNTVYSRLRKLRRRFDAAEAQSRVERLRTGRPAASAKGWAMLVPLLGEPPRAIATGGLAWLSSRLAAGVGGKGIGAVVFATAVGATAAVLATGRASIVETDPLEPVSAPATGEAVVAEPPEAPRPVASEADESREPPAETVAAASTPHVRPTALPRGSTGSPRPSSHVVTPDEDLRLAKQTAVLRDVASAIRDHRAEQAWRLLEDLDTEFPQGDLQDLRAALRIETLCALGRTRDARRETAEFDVRHGRSPLRRRVLRSCGATTADEG